VVPGWAGLLRWYAAGEIGLTLLLIWGEGQGLPGTVLVIALLLLALAALIGLGAYRPFEARRLRRMAATLATLAAIALLIWQPVLQPAAGWLGEVLVTSPIGRWYHVWALRAERTELGERAKTEALRQLQGPLTDAHRQRWERGIQQVPNLHLTEGLHPLFIGSTFGTLQYEFQIRFARQTTNLAIPPYLSPQSTRKSNSVRAYETQFSRSRSSCEAHAHYISH